MGNPMSHVHNTLRRARLDDDRALWFVFERNEYLARRLSQRSVIWDNAKIVVKTMLDVGEDDVEEAKSRARSMTASFLVRRRAASASSPRLSEQNHHDLALCPPLVAHR